jgi:hypothetical protein
LPAGRVFTELRCQLREDDQQARCINGAAGSWFLCRTFEGDAHEKAPPESGAKFACSLPFQRSLPPDVRGRQLVPVVTGRTLTNHQP